MSARSESGAPPKRRVTTYGKGTRKNTPSSGLENESPAPLNRLRSPPVMNTTADGAKPIKKLGQGGPLPRLKDRVKPAQEPRPVADASAWDAPDDEEEGARVKKRKLAKTPPTVRKIQTPAYSPPTSPSSSPSSARTPERDASKTNPRRRGQPNPNGRVTKDISSLAKDTARTSLSSPKGPRGVNIGGDNAQRMPFRLNKDDQVRPAAPATVAGRVAKAATPRQSGASMPPRRKKRLIDALVAQVEESSGEDDDDPPQDVVMTPVSSPPPQILPSTPGPSLTEPRPPRSLARQHSTAKKPGPKFTYSQQRTMLAEDPLMDTAGLGSIDEDPGKAPLLGLGAMIKSSTLSSFSFIDEEDDTVNTGAVRSLHELRQAGANSRFADEMDDILDRIGHPTPQPSSLRRGALLELAQKMREKAFRRQFRSHSGDGGLFNNLDKEVDVISGFAILSILATLLSTSTSPHVIQKLQTQGVDKLLSHLLTETSDISVIAKDRKRNVSKNGQSTLSAIKTDILQLPIWEPVSPTTLSPRTLALKGLDLILRQSTDLHGEAAVFSSTVTDHLFSILSGFANPACWEIPSQPEAVDFYLALYLLETHSVTAMQSQHGSRWTSEYLPIVADLLETALLRPADKFDHLENLALRLTLNTTNNNPDAPEMFVKRGILRDLAEAACKTFEVVLKSITDDSFMSRVLESLIFMIGVKINFCEHYTPAAQNLYEMEDNNSSPLNRLIRVFLDYHSTTADVSILFPASLSQQF